MKRRIVFLIVSILFFGSMKAQNQNYYTPDGVLGEHSYACWYHILLDGELQTSDNIEIGVFINDVCKVSDRVKSYYSGNWYGICFNATYNLAEGETATITFRLYNHETSEEITNCSLTEVLSGGTYGNSPMNHANLEFTHTYAIAVSANPTEGGIVTGAGTYTHGASVTLTATPNEDYNFVNWTEDGVEVSTEANYTFNATSARTLVANFQVAPYGPAYPWTVDPTTSQGGDNGYIVAIVQINGEIITDGTNWVVGAFDSDEQCHGVATIENGWVPNPDPNSYAPYPNYIMMMLYGNGGEVLNFYLYNTEDEAVYPGVCDFTVTYTPNCAFGDLHTPKVLNFVTAETFTKQIIGYGNNTTGGYYLIASPIGEVDPENVENMLSNSYDLFYFDQTQELEWINYKGSDGGYNLMPGKGYLYANSNTVNLNFTGRPIQADTYDVTLIKDDAQSNNGGFEGWNLVGNPFAQIAYINKPFYTMNSDGTKIIAATSSSIEVMEGIFVIAETNEETLTFSKTQPQSKGQIVLDVTQNRGEAIDRAIVRFDGDVLPKFMLNQNDTKMYIPDNGDDYAVVRSNKSGELPVSFEPTQNGSYTISVNPENVNMSYLHLIDKLRHTDINLLITPNYSFEAKTTDPTDRFVLVYKAAINPFNQLVIKDKDHKDFSFFSNGNWIINNDGDAILQVVDVNGQILSSEQINGCVSKSIEAAPGVYMLRLIKGENVKVQKIVVQ